MRARRSFYLGQSPSHSSSVGLVLSLKTGHISPQWHCVFDDLFSTVVSPRGLTDTFDLDKWRQLVSSSLEHYNYKDYDDNNVRLAAPSLAPEWHPDDDDSSAVSHVFPSPPLPELGRTLPAEPPRRTLSDVIEDIVKDMSPTSRTEGADEVAVNPPMPAPEGEVIIDTIDDVWDQAPVEYVPEP
jgi:hypothetical protein